MDKVNYLEEANRQLTDERCYKKLDSDPTEEFSSKITQEVKIMKENSHIDKNTFNYLKPNKPKDGRFYRLPKFHKVNNPGRPIVSANGHPTEKIAEFDDFHLRPHVEALPSHLKDTTDYLQKMESMNALPSGIILVSMDVTSLYTNIPHNDVSKHVERPGTKEPLKNLRRNVLSSCSHWYWNITTLHLLESILYKSTEPLWEQRWHLHTPTSSWGNLKKLIVQSAPHKPRSWFRFIDDVDMKWTESEENLNRFFDHANNAHPTIKFTHETSRNNISFLDTYTTCENGIMSTDIYNKPTDKHQYLSSQSCHPKHCTKSIPYSQALRIKRICSNEQTTKINGLGNWNVIWKRGVTTMRALTIVLAKQVVLTEKTSSNIKKRRQTTECHLSSHTILRSVVYPTSFVSTGQPYKNTQNCAKSSKNHPSWLSGNPKVWKISWWELTSPLDLPTMVNVKNVIRDDVWRAKTSNAHTNSAAHIHGKNSSYTAMPTARRKILSTSWNMQFVTFYTSEKLSNNLVNAWMATSDANCKPDLPLSRYLRSTDHHDSFAKLKVTIIDHGMTPKWDDKSRQER